MEGSLKFLSLLVVAVVCFQVCYTVKVETVFSWNSFVFENLPHSGNAIVGKHHFQYYNSCSILPYSVSYLQSTQCVFLSTPRRAHSIPATGAFFDLKKNHHNKSPSLCGFPSYVHNYVPGWFGVNTLPDDDYKYNIYPGYTKSTPYYKSHHFISIVYSRIGDQHCKRLYFVDTGTLEYPEGNICVRPPIIWGFAIDGCSEHEFDKPPALKVTIPAHLVKDPTGFGAFDVDQYGNCEQFALYLPNYKDNRVIVYDNVKRSFWYFEHETFCPQAERPFITDYNAPEDLYNLGVLSVIVGQEHNGYCDVYYAPGSSCGIFETSSTILRDYSLAPGKPNAPGFNFVGYNASPLYGAILNYDEKTSVLFSVRWFSNVLTCWNTKKPHDDKHVVTLFSDLKYGADLLIDPSRNLWFLLLATNANPVLERKYVHDYQYQLYKANIDNLIHGTACDPNYFG